MVLNEADLNASKFYSLSWSEFSTSLSVAAQNLRHKEGFVDVTVSAGGRNFPAHKLVLSAASPLLMDLLKNTTCQHPILMLAGISASDLETILNFVYHGEINIDADKLPSLLQAAQFLDIRALSPAALVLNSLPSSLSSHTTTVENVKPSDHDVPSLQSEKDNGSDDETNVLTQKRKRHIKFNSCSELKEKSTAPSNTTSVPKLFKTSSENTKISPLERNVVSQHKSNESYSQVEGFPVPDEKKIVSDLPVICKLCGVTIRQSRNLRRHMDQMHSKIKMRKTEDPKDDSTTSKNINKDITTVSDTASSLLDFSDESFNQFTDEIFNYSTMSDNSSSTSSVISVGNCLTEDVTQTGSSTTSTQSTLLYTLSSGSVAQSLNTLLGDLCFHLPTTTPTTDNTILAEDKKLTTTDSRTSEGGLDYTHIENECCNSNDDAQDIMAFKEFDNQLLSACFCTSENDA